MNSSVDGKVIAITGASSGIGEATSLHLAERVAKLILAARGRERLESLAKRVNEAGRQAHFQSPTLHAGTTWASLVGLALDKFGRLDALFNNAGIGPISPLDDLQVEDWDAMVRSEHQRRSVGHCGCAAYISKARLRTLHQHSVHGRNQDYAKPGRVFGNEVCG
jgi:NADP-dependent 3-hydroxy acid dehydrogenase YdfG